MSPLKVQLSRREALLGLSMATAACVSPALANAPLTGAVGRPQRYRGKLGSFEVSTIADGGFFRDEPHKFLAVNATQEDVSETLAEEFYPPDFYELGFAPAIVNTGTEVVLFDAGIGAVRRPDAGKLRARLATVDLKPEQVDVIVLTHLHIDHTGGLFEDGAPAFPNARYVVSAPEFDYWTMSGEPLNSDLGVIKLSANFARENLVGVADRMTFIKPGEDVVSGITALDVRGHTPGHLAFNIESDGERLVVAGDALIHPALSFRRPDWQHVFDFDAEAAAKSRIELLGMLAADRVPFTAYHMPLPSIGYVERHDDAYRYVAAGYQLNRF
ncbi:MAG: MBL fold metallo-hydrolase [Pseudomonadota bacterium]